MQKTFALTRADADLSVGARTHELLRGRTMRQLHFDPLRPMEGDRQGSHGSRRARRYILA